MIRRTSTILLVSLVLCAFLATAAFAAQNGNEAAKMSKSPKRILTYSFPDEHNHTWGTSSSVEQGPVALGSMTAYPTPYGASPGQTVGWTYYDYQHNCSMGRMVETGPHSGEVGATTVHFGWMHLPDSVFEARTYAYNSYKSETGLFSGQFLLHDPEEQYSGYVNVDVTPDNRALVGGHSDMKGPIPYQAQIHFDLCSSCNLFDAYVRVPDELSSWEQVDGQETTWPKFFFQFGASNDTVLHIVAQANTNNTTYHQTIMYFRKVGYEGSPEAVWDYPPYCVDSTPIIAHDITGERMGNRVCMAWFANLPYQEPTCDTCSGESPYDAGFMDNDMYLQISEDQGASWNPRQNLSQAVIGDAGFKPWCDCSILFDQSSNCHILFHVLQWPGDPCIAVGEDPCLDGDVWQSKSRLMHWSENVPYVRTVADHAYDQSDSCGVPGWGTHVAKMGLGECDGKLYAMWSQFHDIPNGTDNDCAQWAYDEGLYWGGANADLWVSVSEDGGMTWDAQRNLTNSYTPHCEPFAGEVCQNDYWATISRWGKEEQGTEDWSGAEHVNPGGDPTDWYLDVMYVNDLDAGGAIWGDEGSWINDPMKWFRLACVEVVDNPLFIPEWTSYGDPHYNKPGQVKLVDLTFENAGNVALDFTIDTTYGPGASDWLGYTGFGTSIPSGLANTVTGTLTLNLGGAIVTPGNYDCTMTVTSNDPSSPHDISIELIVTDTICPLHFDVVNTGVISLNVSNYGNMAHEEEKLSLDFYPEDCDTTATVYLYDGSPFIGRGTGPDAVFYNGLWRTSWLMDYGFRPQCGHTPNDEPCGGLDGADVYESGTFSTQDSTLGLEKIWVAPAEDVSYIIQYMKVWSFDGNSHDDVMIGEVLDWDLPWDYKADDIDLDTTSVNSGHADGPNLMLYCQGYEAYGANVDTSYPYNCQYNDNRFGGHAFVEAYVDGAPKTPYNVPYGGFCGENDDLVYPATEGFLFEPFYDLAIVPGLTGTTWIEDLHTAMVYERDLDFTGTTVYEVVAVLVTIQDGTLEDLQAALTSAKAWYAAHGGITMFVDGDLSGKIDICETCCQVMGDFNHDGAFNPLDAAAFVTWMWRGGAAPYCLDECNVNCSPAVDPLDAAYMVAYFWGGGPAPCNCSELP